jgi:hypothetical protein
MRGEPNITLGKALRIGLFQVEAVVMGLGRWMVTGLIVSSVMTTLIRIPGTQSVLLMWISITGILVFNVYWILPLTYSLLLVMVSVMGRLCISRPQRHLEVLRWMMGMISSMRLLIPFSSPWRVGVLPSTTPQMEVMSGYILSHSIRI